MIIVKLKLIVASMNKEPIIFFNFMGFRNFGKIQLGIYSANFNWEGAVKWPL